MAKSQRHHGDGQDGRPGALHRHCRYRLLPANLQPFAPFGFAGISAAAGTIFFTYVGLDAVSTAGEEVENPKRNLPIAIIAALVIVTSLYVLVAVTAIGVQPAAAFEGQEAGLATILQNLTGSNWPALVLAIGAVISVFSVTLVVLYGQTRILFAMSRDGMIPELFHRVNPRTMSPVANTIIVALFVGAIAAFVPDAILWDLTSMGTLVAFMVVSAGVMILRQTRPDMQRGFRVPFYPVLPILSILSCLYLIYNLDRFFELFGVWLVFAAVFYFAYSARNSRLEKPAGGHEVSGRLFRRSGRARGARPRHRARARNGEAWSSAPSCRRPGAIPPWPGSMRNMPPSSTATPRRRWKRRRPVGKRVPAEFVSRAAPRPARACTRRRRMSARIASCSVARRAGSAFLEGA